VYTYIYIYIYINVYTYTYVYVHIYKYTHIRYMFIHIYKHTCIHISISIRLCVYTDEARCHRESVKTQIATFGDCILSLDAAFQLSSEGTCSTTADTLLFLGHKGIRSLAPGLFANMSKMTWVVLCMKKEYISEEYISTSYTCCVFSNRQGICIRECACGVCVCTCIHVHICVCLCAHTYNMNTLIYASCVCVCVCVCVCLDVRTHTHTHTVT